MPPVRFVWVPERARYETAGGRALTRKEVRTALDRSLLGTQRRMMALAQDARAGRVSVSQWQRGMYGLIKDVHLYSAAAARGGWAQMTKRDYGRVGSVLRKQYTFLNRFAGELDAGLPMDGRFLSRVELYAESGRATYHRIDEVVQGEIGMTEERSVLHPADHCSQCVAEAMAGWQRIGTLTPIGERLCLSRCHCTMEYR